MATQQTIPTVSDVRSLYGTPSHDLQDLFTRSHDCDTALEALGRTHKAQVTRYHATIHYQVMARLEVSGHYAAKVTYETALALALDAGKDVLVLTAGLFVHLEEMQSMFVLIAILASLLCVARVLTRWAEHDD